MHHRTSPDSPEDERTEKDDHSSDKHILPVGIPVSGWGIFEPPYSHEEEEDKKKNPHDIRKEEIIPLPSSVPLHPEKLGNIVEEESSEEHGKEEKDPYAHPEKPLLVCEVRFRKGFYIFFFYLPENRVFESIFHKKSD